MTLKAGEENVTWKVATSRDWFSQLFYEGMKERDGIGRIQAEILNVYSYDTSPDRKALYLTAKLKAVYSKSTQQYTFKGKPVLVGNTIKLSVDNVNFEGLIVNIDGMNNPREEVVLKIETRLNYADLYQETLGALPYIADAVNTGDIVYDNRGNPVLTIDSKKVEDAKRIVTTSDGRVLLRPNPLLKDLHLSATVNAIKVGGKYFLFDDIPISIGVALPINLPTISIFAEVTKITVVQ